MTTSSTAQAFDAALVEEIARDEQGKARSFFGEACGLSAALLPILHRLQDTFGHVDAQSWPIVARVLNISQAEVRGTASFYHDYRQAPAGRHVLKLCRAEACQSMGVEALADHLSRHHRLSPGGTSADGRLTVENVYCLGNCALSPAALFDDRLVGRLDEARLDALVAEAAR